MRTALAATCALVVVAAAPAGTTKASLRIVDADPLTARGAGFHPEQSIRVAVTQAGRLLLRRTVRSGRLGGFTVVLSTAAAHRCGGDLALAARDASGRRALAKVPLPDCPPPLAP